MRNNIELILQNSYIDSFKTKREKSQTIRFIFFVGNRHIKH